MNMLSAHCLANSSVPTAAGGLSAGVALCSTWAAGLVEFDVPLVKAPPPERFKTVLWDAVVQGGVLLGTVYLLDGIGLAELNINLLQEIAGYVNAIGLPYILSGDWNVAPAVLIASGWPAAIQGTVVAPDQPTYRSGPASDVKDFFVVDDRLCAAEAVVSCQTRPTDTIAKHDPVELVLRGVCKDHKVSVLKRPPKLSLERVQGCQPPAVRWENSERTQADIVDEVSLTEFYSASTDFLSTRSLKPLAKTPSALNRQKPGAKIQSLSWLTPFGSSGGAPRCRSRS